MITALGLLLAGELNASANSHSTSWRAGADVAIFNLSFSMECALAAAQITTICQARVLMALINAVVEINLSGMLQEIVYVDQILCI